MTNCIFCNIVNKVIPSQLIYEDLEITVFNDKYPKAPLHWLIIPKQHIDSMLTIKEEHTLLLGKMMALSSQLAKQWGLEGYQLHINVGAKGGQEVFHLHLHLLSNA